MADFPDLTARARRDGAAAQAVGVGEATTQVAVAAVDRSGLFADLATALSAAGADVVSARVATAAEGTALDVFEVQDGAGAPYGQAEPRRLTRLIAALEAAARGDAAPTDAPAQAVSARRAAFEVLPVVAIDADAADGATVIEVSGADRPGLLADLARIFADEGLSIRSAHIASFGARAVDAFYVTDAKGRKPRAGARMERLATALEAVLDRAPAPAEGRRAAPVRASTRDVSELKGRPRAPAA